MTEEFSGESLSQPEGIETISELNASRRWYRLWEALMRLGLGDIVLRAGSALVLLGLVLLVVWVMGTFYLAEDEELPTSQRGAAIAAPLPTATVTIKPPAFKVSAIYAGAFHDGVTRLAELRTVLPARPRFEIVRYVVQPGDTIFGIAEMFNLQPETVLWGNYYILADDPHRLKPDQVLNILPVDGVYYEWHAGDGLNGVADFYGVAPEAILNWPGNNLDPETIGDWADPNIQPSAWLVIPGGRREFVTWSAPRITREDPAVASVFGPGSCEPIFDGPIGDASFIWPSVERYVSGFDYSPSTNHYGIDIAGDEGFAIFGADDGVVVYAGWNDWGYGYTVVIDHGNGWQSLYAHLSAYAVECGAYVYEGDIIATMGSTGNSSGPHLHFELRSDEFGRPNPWNFLTR
jgi:hypothetical protein